MTGVSLCMSRCSICCCGVEARWPDSGWIATNWTHCPQTVRMSRRQYNEKTDHVNVGIDVSGKGSRGKTNGIILVHYWKINAWCWDSDGKFARRNDTLEFEIKEELRPSNMGESSEVPSKSADEETKITDTDVIPIHFLAPEIEQKL